MEISYLVNIASRGMNTEFQLQEVLEDRVF